MRVRVRSGEPERRNPDLIQDLANFLLVRVRVRVSVRVRV